MITKLQDFKERLSGSDKAVMSALLNKAAKDQVPAKKETQKPSLKIWNTGSPVESFKKAVKSPNLTETKIG